MEDWPCPVGCRGSPLSYRRRGRRGRGPRGVHCSSNRRCGRNLVCCKAGCRAQVSSVAPTPPLVHTVAETPLVVSLAERAARHHGGLQPPIPRVHVLELAVCNVVNAVLVALGTLNAITSAQTTLALCHRCRRLQSGTAGVRGHVMMLPARRTALHPISRATGGDLRLCQLPSAARLRTPRSRSSRCSAGR